MRKLSVVSALGLILGFAPSASASSIGLVPNDGCIPYTTATGITVQFCDADVNPTGTGTFNPFLRVNPDGNETNRNPSSGWNTDANKSDWTQPNDADDSWTSSLAASSLSTVLFDGQEYKAFDVDINQEGQPGDPQSLLSLIHFQLYTCSTADYTDLSGCSNLLNVFGGTVGYNATTDRPEITGSDDWVDFDYRNHTGSGDGDIRVFVPVSVFAGAQFVSLLDSWGTFGTGASAVGSYGDNDGFQEWRALQCPAGVNCDGGGGGGGINAPEPASLLMFGSAFAVFAARARARRKKN